MSTIRHPSIHRLPKLTGQPNPQKRKRKRKRRQQVEGHYSGTSIDSVYGNPRAPGSFGSVRNLQRYGHRSEHDVKKFLSGTDAYTLHKPRRIRFPRRKTYSKNIANLFQIDLADLSNLSPFNNGMRYFLTCIDVFTKRAWAVPTRTKSGKEVAEAFQKIIDEQKCNMVQNDNLII